MSLKTIDSSQYPPLSIVVIGLNVAEYLRSSLNAILNSTYPSSKMEIIYVDSGSTDGSLDIARSFEQVNVIELDTSNPSAAMGRNAGAAQATYDLIQFVDADSYLHPNWLETAVTYLNPQTAAVAGRLSERYPEKNLFHRMAELEWNIWSSPDGSWTTEALEAKTFGGNVLLYKSVFLGLKGFDEELKAGEDPDLSYRIRREGYRILRLNENMASHDINLCSFSDYRRRTRRSGSAYANLALRYWRESERFMLKPLIRIIAGVLTPATVLILGFSAGFPLPGFILALLIMFRLVFQTGKFARLFNISHRRALEYSLYLAIAIYPQFFGVTDVVIQKFNNWMQRSRTDEPTLEAISL